MEANNVIKYKASEFNDNYRALLVADREYLKELFERWQSVNSDPKLDAFSKKIEEDEILKSSKVLIFTESRETEEYLFKHLDSKYKNQILHASGKSKGAELERIRQNFDPKEKHDDKNIRMLVTTDILAEGINLHKANVIVNYDIPWNSIKILQRVGRVNRVGTQHNKIFIYNFFPTSQAEQEIGLEKLAIAKIQAFHDTLGEDTKYLTGDEEFSSWELFSRINSNKVLEDENKDVESELGYLQEIRRVRDEQIDLFARLKVLPIKARTAKKNNNNTLGLVTFFRRGSLKKFFKTGKDKSEEIDFFGAVRLLKAKSTDPKESIPSNYHEMLQINKTAFEESIKSEADEEIERRGGGSEKTLVVKIKALLNSNKLTEDDEIYLHTLAECLDEGSVSKKLVNKVVNKTKGFNDPLKIYSVIKVTIEEKYLINLNKFEGQNKKVKREIILSEALV